jgi:hypothetical protein
MQNLLSLYLVDLNGLTRRERCRLAWYAAIIAIPLVAVILATHWYGPGLSKIIGW